MNVLELGNFDFHLDELGNHFDIESFIRRALLQDRKRVGSRATKTMRTSTVRLLIAAILVASLPGCLSAWGFGSSDPGKVLLRDVQVLTLKSGQMTTGRRSSPVPQLNCVGGSAQGQFKPQVVQCYNRGSDGQDVQWECKSDMDNLYRFGNVEVICEGYDYPDDPYILKGSCGLEYTLEYTKARNKKGVKSRCSSSISV